MSVKIDESGRHHQARDVDCLRARKWSGRDCGNSPVTDPDVTNGIQSRFVPVVDALLGEVSLFGGEVTVDRGRALVGGKTVNSWARVAWPCPCVR